MKGLVKLKFPRIAGDPTRKPVNKQAAFIIRPAREEFKPMPSDPE